VYAEALPAQHLFVAATRQLLGEALLRRGQFAAAEIEIRAALDIDIALAGSRNWRTARTEASLGWLLIEENNADEGEPILVSAQKSLLSTLGANHPETMLATSRLAAYYRAHHREADANRVLPIAEADAPPLR
jgi:hypothetical protein